VKIDTKDVDMKIAITGASGFIGKALQDVFSDTVAIKRNDTEDMILEKLKDIDIVINLAGAPIIRRWSDPYKKILTDSRIDTTQNLVSAVNKSNVKQLISTSAIGIYPDDTNCDESCIHLDRGFLGQLSKEWEFEAFQCTKPTAILRFGVLLGKNGGALAQMLTPFRLGFGGVIGDGKMYTSWIHIDDLIGIYKYIIDKELTGVFNATAPEPVTNYTFTKALGKALHRPTIIPIPKIALWLMYGEASSVLIGSKEVYPKRIYDNGYRFKYPQITEALEDIIHN
jgi:uncharacterized protein (TIGR01777 family)